MARDAPLAGDNVAYAWHVYSGHDENDVGRWAEKLDGLQTVAPVIVTEWGFDPRKQARCQGTARSFGYRWVKRFVDGRGLHSTAWCWQPHWTPSLSRVAGDSREAQRPGLLRPPTRSPHLHGHRREPDRQVLVVHTEHVRPLIAPPPVMVKNSCGDALRSAGGRRRRSRAVHYKATARPA